MSFWPELRYACRFFMRRPAFTALAVVTLALGIGANTAIFSVIKSVVFAPLPYRAPGDLVLIWNAPTRDGRTWLSMREILQYRAEASSVARLSAYTNANLDLLGGDEPERVRGASVTPDLFDTLGVAPIEGRGLTAADGQPGANPVIVLGEGLWRRRFGGAREMLGRTIQVNGRAREVVGIMPASVRLPLDYRADRPTEAFVPATVDAANPGPWGDRSYYGIARLAPGITAAAATAQLHAIGDGWIRAGHVQDNGDGAMRRNAVPVRTFVTGDVRRPMLILAAAVGVVLLIACANVINLLLTKAEVRRREIVVRMALGAERRQIVRQVLIESLVLAAAGGIAGVAVAAAGLKLLVLARPALIPRLDEAAIDGGVLAFTAGLSAVAAVVFGLVPAFQFSTPSLAPVLNAAGRAAGGRARASVRRALVIAQLAATVVLLVGAALLVRSLLALQRVDLGFDPRGVLTAQLQVSAASYPQPTDVVSFYQRLLERIEALPGVTAAGAIRLLPLTQTIGNWSITVEGATRAPGDNPNGDFQWVTAGYFRAMRTPLVRGRLITGADREDAPLVAVINETMAERYWPGQDAVGQRFHMGTADQPWMTVVGVLGRTHHNSFTESARAEMYLPHAQLPLTIRGAPRAMALVIRTDVEPLSIAPALRATIRDLDPSLPVSEIRSLEQIVSDSLSESRFAAVLLGVFAGIALILAMVGVYGTISLLVTERVPEIGLRVALGATRWSILGMVLRQGLALAAIGIAIGLAGAAALTRLLTSVVYGVSTLDPVTFAAVPLILALVAALASLVPARRAAAVDPVVTLRS
jgi:predicted permease